MIPARTTLRSRDANTGRASSACDGGETAVTASAASGNTMTSAHSARLRRATGGRIDATPNTGSLRQPYTPGTSPRGRQFAAQHAECVFMSGPSAKVIAPRVSAIRALPDVAIRHLEALYPDGRIDVAAEQAAAAAAERIVFQFPFYWYSVPPLLKRWMDDVFAFGWAYGPGGTKLRGKTLQPVLTTGGAETAYRPGGYNLYPVRELLRPLEVTANLMGMTMAEPLVLYGDGAVHAAQAWTALRGRGYTHTYTLLEGLDAWKDEVLFPVMQQGPSPSPEQQARFAARSEEVFDRSLTAARQRAVSTSRPAPKRCLRCSCRSWRARWESARSDTWKTR